MILVIEDLNAKIGCGAEGNIAGAYGYGFGTRNHRGDRLIQFCAENKLTISNTFFQLPPRRLYTGKSLADSEINVIRNQIDFILVTQQMRKFNFSWCRFTRITT